MAKCIKCGGSFLTRGRIRLKDADICFKCFDSLGFNHKDGIYNGKQYRWDDIKDGYYAYRAKENVRIKAHEKWLEEHPETLDFMAAIDEGHEPDEVGADQDQDE